MYFQLHFLTILEHVTRLLLPSHLSKAVSSNFWLILSFHEDFVEFLFLFFVVVGKYLANLNRFLFYVIKSDWGKKCLLFILIFVASNGYMLLSFLDVFSKMAHIFYLQIQASFFQKVFQYYTCSSSVLFFASSILGITYVELTSLVFNIYFFFSFPVFSTLFFSMLFCWLTRLLLHLHIPNAVSAVVSYIFVCKVNIYINGLIFSI